MHKINKVAINIVHFICWIVLVCKYLAVFFFWVLDSIIQVILVYFCVDLWLLYAVTNTSIIFLVDSNSKFTLLYTYPLPFVYVPSEL